MIPKGETVSKVNVAGKKDIEKNYSATHLLQSSEKKFWFLM